MTPLRSRLLVFSALAMIGPLSAQDDARKEHPLGALVQQAPRDDAAAERLGWRLAVQAWTFRDRTAFEAIDTARALGIRYIELFPGQKLAPAHGEAKVAVDMKDELRSELLAHAEEANVRIVNFGVVEIGTDEAAARRLYTFAKALGLETLTCEPELEAWDLVEKLSDEFRINAACHDHPKPSTYWNPDTVLAAVKGRSKRLGACADTGHWPRSGLDTVECLHKLAGRIVSMHFKDIAPADKTGVDQPWGTGKGNARAMLEELRRQGFRGVIAVEYETGTGKELEANVRKCIAWFDATAKELEAAAPATAPAKPAGKQ
jgi:sugar phosphate isomerase/epimerase